MELQLHWDVEGVRAHFGTGPDTEYLMSRLGRVLLDVMGPPGPQRILEVAAAEAVHSCRLQRRGAEVYVVEPSPVMLARARERMTEYGATLTLVRGIAETLPFRDQTFDRVLIDSAIDHVADPELAIREMTRVTKPDGRLVISFVNYESASVRLSRRLYRIARRLGLVARDARLFWDSPVPTEHTFECTYSIIRELCAPYLELDAAFGVSMGWMVPGWASVLKRLSPERALRLIQRLDRAVAYRPRRADVVVSIWQPRRHAAAPRPRRATVEADDPLYRSRAGAEAEFWGKKDFTDGIFVERGRPDSGDVWIRMANDAFTGDPHTLWIDDLIGRGPFATAAALGCDEGGFERRWVHRGGSEQLHVYELSKDVIRTVRGRLDLGWRPSRRVRFVPADLNFVRLPHAHFDVVWSSRSLHHVANLEHLVDEVEQALRPGGLFAIHEYVGERRLQYARARLARMNALLAEVPERYRSGSEIGPAQVATLSPFCGIRSDDILPLLEARFDVVHRRFGGALYPVTLTFDLAAIEREMPELFAHIVRAEQEALADPTVRPCLVYAVFRKRERAAPAVSPG